MRRGTLLASLGSFGILWANSPYDHDKTASDSKRVEFALLRHSWKWVQPGGLVMWCVYRHRITESAAAFLAKHSSHVDVWGLSGKHLGEYDQIVVVARVGTPMDVEALRDHILTGKANPRPLTPQAEPVYTLPPPPAPGRRFVFAPDIIDEAQGLRLIEEAGAHLSNGFQALLAMPPTPETIEPIVPPRPGHLALVLAAGIANGAVIETEEYGAVALRSKIVHVEDVARVEVEGHPDNPEQQVKKTTMRLKPTTTLTLLAQDGTGVEMAGDEALLDFIKTNRKALVAYLNRRFEPLYTFDFNGLGRFLDGIRLKGRYPLYTAQKHVIGAVTRGFESRDSILLIGQMGTGKTAIGGAAAIAIASGVVDALRDDIRPDQVMLVVCPPHLVEKWQRELLSISPHVVVEKLQRHEDVKAFMATAARLGPGIATIGLIKRDMTKLGSGRGVAVVWREEARALWPPHQAPPEGYERHERIVKARLPKCPHYGATVTQERKETVVVASEHWLKSGKRQCRDCDAPLWQESRDKGSRPRPCHKYPPRNPRYALADYLQRFYPDRVYLLIWDEAHESKNSDTGNGVAFSRLAGVANKVLALTGTPFNGRASSLFNLEYAMNPRARQHYSWGPGGRERGKAESRWVADMGVRERVLEDRPTYDSTTGEYTGRTTYERPYEEAPGCSPLLVAELLDHAIFFSLKDLGKALPEYEEVALPVEMDADTGAEYERTRALLKDYLVQRRWEGDTTFRGSYLQWARGWPNAAFRPHAVIHNVKDAVTGEKHPLTVATIPGYGEERVYAKEQALLDLVEAELAANRPVVVYLRQTATRDIQLRIAGLLARLPGVKPFILKNTVGAERREMVIQREVTKGTNGIVCNPKLVETGLDLLFAPTLIFFEIVFNLSTMMQAAAQVLDLTRQALDLKPVDRDLLDRFEATHDETVLAATLEILRAAARARKEEATKPATRRRPRTRRRRRLDMLAVPEEGPAPRAVPVRVPVPAARVAAPQQLPLF